MLQFPKIRKMRIQKSLKSMIFGPIACFRRLGSRISGQKAIPGSKNEKFRTNLGGWLSVTEKIKNSRGWNQITSTAQPREFLIFL